MERYHEKTEVIKRDDRKATEEISDHALKARMFPQEVRSERIGWSGGSRRNPCPQRRCRWLRWGVGAVGQRRRDRVC